MTTGYEEDTSGQDDATMLHEAAAAAAAGDAFVAAAAAAAALARSAVTGMEGPTDLGASNVPRNYPLHGVSCYPVSSPPLVPLGPFLNGTAANGPPPSSSSAFAEHPGIASFPLTFQSLPVPLAGGLGEPTLTAAAGAGAARPVGVSRTGVPSPQSPRSPDASPGAPQALVPLSQAPPSPSGSTTGSAWRGPGRGTPADLPAGGESLEEPERKDLGRPRRLAAARARIVIGLAPRVCRQAEGVEAECRSLEAEVRELDAESEELERKCTSLLSECDRLRKRLRGKLMRADALEAAALSTAGEAGDLRADSAPGRREASVSRLFSLGTLAEGAAGPSSPARAARSAPSSAAPPALAPSARPHPAPGALPACPYPAPGAPSAPPYPSPGAPFTRPYLALASPFAPPSQALSASPASCALIAPSAAAPPPAAPSTGALPALVAPPTGAPHALAALSASSMPSLTEALVCSSCSFVVGTPMLSQASATTVLDAPGDLTSAGWPGSRDHAAMLTAIETLNARQPGVLYDPGSACRQSDASHNDVSSVESG